MTLAAGVTIAALGAAAARGAGGIAAAVGTSTTTRPPKTLPTTTVALAPPTAPVPSTAPEPAPTTPGTAPAAFDAVPFFREVYRTLSLNPSDLLDEQIQQAVPGSPAEVFVVYLFALGIAHLDNTAAPLPLFTVTPAGNELNVCDEADQCQVFGKFATSGGLLRSFSIEGQPIDDRLGFYGRPTTVDMLTIDGSVVFKRPGDEALSVILLFRSEGGGATFTWPQALFVDESGREFNPDVTTSLFTERVEQGQLGSAMLQFPEARPDGDLTIPFTSDQTGVETSIRIPVLISEFR